MYQWFINETDEICWKRFFKFERDANPKLITAIEKDFGALPRDYTEFIQKFGTAKMFRNLERGSYNLGVFSHPKMREGQKGELLLELHPKPAPTPEERGMFYELSAADRTLDAGTTSQSD
jgi:hypothetical protein